jgi:Holliday junction resolvase RusA-like endonuclease
MDPVATPTVSQPFVAEIVAIMAPTNAGDPDEMESVVITVEGQPRVQERTRMSGGPNPHLYDPSSLLKGKFRWAVRKALRNELAVQTFPLFTGPLKMRVVFYIDNMTKDIDNLQKFTLDALNLIVYRDDRNVHQVTAIKQHSPDHGYTVIMVEPFRVIHRID